jgi:hypothetical protein
MMSQRGSLPYTYFKNVFFSTPFGLSFKTFGFLDTLFLLHSKNNVSRKGKTSYNLERGNRL